uniref:Septin 12 n=1 Tax=Nothobranchius kuhntae TaxID=321403 RepID=A0A1A8HWD8_NOTKU
MFFPPSTALKRSFDSEDDVLSFTSAFPTSAPISPSSCHFFLGHNKEREEHTGSDQPPSFSFNSSVDSVAHSHVCLSSSLSPVLKTRAVGSSLSFTRGTMTRPVFHNNVSSVTRAVSFQSKLNPNVCSSLLSPGSDNDSLHSSTSSLEYSSVGGYSLPATKLTSYYSPLHQREYQEAQCQRPSQVEPNYKFSFHGGVSKSKINPDHDMVLDIREVRRDSIPAEKEAKVEMPRGVGEGRISPGITYVDANDSWNGLRNVNAVGGKKVPQKVFKTPKPEAKEVPRLNKFPLDLDSLESEEKERGIMGEEQDDGGKNLGHEKIQTFESEENCMEGCTEEEEKEKGMETGKDAELEAEVKAELRPSDSDSQTSFIRGSDLFGYVGIEDVLDQMRRKTMKAGFEFNIMVVGQSGLGKSTLVNTLFKSKVSRKSCSSNYEEKITKTVKLHSISHVIEEKGVKMKLTVIDTPGFGDQINNENCWEPIVKYVNEQYERYLREELNINRKRRIPDSRVHCCIYFLPATGHRLRPLDVEFMKRLGEVVSIVPVIAKADTLTVDERQEFKERIKQDLAANGIHIYPQREYDEDTEERVLNDRIRESLPFAVVGTDKEHQVNGNKVLGRKTKWGIIEVENLAHCEFANLRDLLIRSHLQDLKDVAHDIHYEAYRVRRLNESNMNFSELVLSTWPLENGTDTCGTESLL